MHHDFNMAQDGHLVVLATKNNTFDGRVMDFVLEVDMETGDVSELLDLRNIFPDYYDKTEKVSDTDPFFWQAGTRDWIHLNTIDYTRDDGLILSSRETSTIIKIGNVHSQPELTYLIGDRDFGRKRPMRITSMRRTGTLRASTDSIPSQCCRTPLPRRGSII